MAATQQPSRDADAARRTGPYPAVMLQRHGQWLAKSRDFPLEAQQPTEAAAKRELWNKITEYLAEEQTRPQGVHVLPFAPLAKRSLRYAAAVGALALMTVLLKLIGTPSKVEEPDAKWMPAALRDVELSEEEAAALRERMQRPRDWSKTRSSPVLAGSRSELDRTRS